MGPIIVRFTVYSVLYTHYYYARNYPQQSPKQLSFPRFLADHQVSLDYPALDMTADCNEQVGRDENPGMAQEARQEHSVGLSTGWVFERIRNPASGWVLISQANMMGSASRR